MDINIFKTIEEVSDNLSNHIIKKHLEGSIALSGGSTPLLLFRSLSSKLSSSNNFNTKFAVDKNHSFRGVDYFFLVPNYNGNRLLEVKT